MPYLAQSPESRSLNRRRGLSTRLVSHQEVYTYYGAEREILRKDLWNFPFFLPSFRFDYYWKLLNILLCIEAVLRLGADRYMSTCLLCLSVIIGYTFTVCHDKYTE